ncbi:proprotein convertase subtilisin/kexin type 5-like [Liolophura sinensis]|uniref:proprotein convertase subtilisin/kexin type 5-like n=1 Tax=Liolophura sinensis TaxID=3198878 RepID=UPI003158A406
MYYLNGSRVCMTGCPKGYFEGYNRLCVECHHDCDVCFGPSNTDCSSCRFTRLGRSCVSKCPVGYVRDTSATCIKPDNCPGYVFKSSCVDQCPSGFYPANASHLPFCKTCNSQCKTCYGPGTHRCHACAKFRYDGHCVSVCPMEAPVIYNQNCLTECQSSNNCKTVCGDQFVWNRKCVKQCPSSEPYSLHGICVTKCPKLRFERKCLEICPKSLVEYNGECMKTCPSGYFTDKATCVKKCKHLSFGMSCRDKCPHKVPHVSGKCVYQCPETLYFINPVNRQCTSHCPYVVFQNQCLLHCPHGYFWSGQVCIFCDKMCSGCQGPVPKNCNTCRHVGNNGVCVRDCPDYTANKTCVAKCPPGTFVAGQRKTCLTSCPNDLPFSFLQECLASCPESSPYHEDGNQACLGECPRETVHLPGQTLCLSRCPENIPMTANHLCVKECPPDRNFTYQKQCLPKCPQSTVFEADKNSCVHCNQKTCVSKCPFFTVEFSGECVRNDGIVGMWFVVIVSGLFALILYIIVCHPSRKGVKRNGPPLVQDEEEAGNNVINDISEDTHPSADDRRPVLAHATQESRIQSRPNRTSQGISRINEMEEVCHEDMICQPSADERTCSDDRVDMNDLRFQSASTFPSNDCTDVVHGTADALIYGAPRLTALPSVSERVSPCNSTSSETHEDRISVIGHNAGRSLIPRLSQNNTVAKPKLETSICNRKLESFATNPMYTGCTEATRDRICESSFMFLPDDISRSQSDKYSLDDSILTTNNNTTAADNTSLGPLDCTTNRRLICKGCMKGSAEGDSPVSGNENNQKFGQGPCPCKMHVVYNTEDIMDLVNTVPPDPTGESLQNINNSEETLLKHV